MERVTVYRYSPDGAGLGVLHYTEAEHREGLDGTDELRAVAYDDVLRNERLLWQDPFGVWHEHIVASTDRTHVGGKPKTEFATYNSIGETWCWTADGTVMTGTVGEILAYLLKDTRWGSDGSDIEGQFTLETYHKQVRQCIAELCEMCGGELETRLSATTLGVGSRKAAIVSSRGSKSVHRQFTYSRNLTGVKRTEDDSEQVYTAVFAYGKALEDGDYPSRVTFAEINGGEHWITNEDALQRWGCIGADGVMHHSCCVYTDDACDDPHFLLSQARTVLSNVSTPALSYEMQLQRMDEGDWWARVGIGDAVHIIDDDMGISMQARVSEIARRFDGKTSGKVVIGKKVNALVEKFRAQETASQKSTGNSSSVGGKGSTYTGGTYGGSGGSGSGGGCDDWTHWINGHEAHNIIVNFITDDSE